MSFCCAVSRLTCSAIDGLSAIVGGNGSSSGPRPVISAVMGMMRPVSGAAILSGWAVFCKLSGLRFWLVLVPPPMLTGLRVICTRVCNASRCTTAAASQQDFLFGRATVKVGSW